MHEGVYSDVDLGADVNTTDREASLVVRAQDDANLYGVIFEPDGLPMRGGGAGGVWLVRRDNYNETTLGYAHPAHFPMAGQSARLRVTAIGSNIAVYFDGVPIISATDATFESGRAGLRIFGDAAFPCDATFQNIRLVPS